MLTKDYLIKISKLVPEISKEVVDKLVNLSNDAKADSKLKQAALDSIPKILEKSDATGAITKIAEWFS